MKITLSLALLAVLAACGKSSSKKPSAPKFPQSGASVEEKVNIPIAISSTDTTLTSTATNFAVQLSGCASGATATATEATPAFTIYKDDSNCVAKLSQLTVNGIAYAGSNPGATDFATSAKNEAAVFTDSTGNNKINLVVTSQLSSPVLAADAISYAFTIIHTGDSKPVGSEVLGESHTVSVGGDLLPSYKIDRINFLGLNANGGGRFTIQTECTAAIVTGAAPSCINVNFTDTSYALVKDTFNGTPTATQLAAMFPGTAVLANQVVTATTNNLGGFVTVALDGPNQISLNPRMLFVLKNGNSYQYFLVTTQAL